MNLSVDTQPAKQNMGRKLKQIIVRILAVVGAITLIWHVIFPLLRSGLALNKPDGKQVFISPSGKFKAVLFNWNGGGGFAPYCYNSISVVPVEVSDASADSERYRVYLGSCHAVGGSDYAPNIKWLSGVELEVTYDLTQAVNGVDHVILKGSAASGKVFVIHKNVTSIRNNWDVECKRKAQ